MYWTILLSVMMVVLLQLVSYTRSKQNVLVVLGSADDRILSERVSAAIEYIESNEDQPIILFISGGVKNAIVNESSDSNFSTDEMPSIVITTSDFHQDRAERIFQGIMPEITPQWNLSKSSCTRCWSDEMIHIKNVQSDITKAIHIVQ